MIKKHTPRLSTCIVLVSMLFVLVACPDPDPDPIDDTDGQYSKGWNSDEDFSATPVALGAGVFGSQATLAANVDLREHLPPIQNQNPYGTCVAWAVAYYSKSAMESITRGITQGDLQSPSYQMSPKDLFYSIPDNRKGDPQYGNCFNTYFTEALDMLISRGVATMAKVPYQNMGDCSVRNLDPSWASDAAKHKIKNYRRIDLSVNAIKEQLNQSRPVIFGADVYQSFEVYSGGIYSANRGSKTGSHAMTIIGYDDSRRAFLIVNSWGVTWGEGGMVWVDCNFTVGGFIQDGNLYVMTDGDNNDPVSPVSPNNNASGADLIPWVNSDYSNYAFSGYPLGRTIDFNIYNSGSGAVSANNWAFYFVYYDAFNANNYGIIFYDQFNSNVASGTFSCPPGNSCTFNVSIPGGSSFAQTVFNTPGVTRNYEMPVITGMYYLVLIVDPNNAVNEINEGNNFFYTSFQNPKYFQNGYSGRKPSTPDFINDYEFDPALTMFRSAVTGQNRNAYTPDEIAKFLREEKKSGRLKIKLDQYKQTLPPYKK